MDQGMADWIVQVISTVGFPISMTLLMFWYMVKEGRKTQDILTEIKLVLAQLTEAINREE